MLSQFIYFSHSKQNNISKLNVNKSTPYKKKSIHKLSKYTDARETIKKYIILEIYICVYIISTK